MKARQQFYCTVFSDTVIFNTPVQRVRGKYQDKIPALVDDLIELRVESARFHGFRVFFFVLFRIL